MVEIKYLSIVYQLLSNDQGEFMEELTQQNEGENGFQPLAEMISQIRYLRMTVYVENTLFLARKLLIGTDTTKTGFRLWS